MNKTEKKRLAETARDFLIAQGKRCEDETETCKYYHDGLRCAIGCLFNEETAKILGSKPVCDTEVIAALKAAGWQIKTTKDVKFLRKVQRIHDYTRGYMYSEKIKNQYNNLIAEL